MNDESRAKRYSAIKYSLTIIETLFLPAFLLFLLMSGISIELAKQLSRFIPVNYLSVPVYLLIISLGYYVLSLPFNFYHSYALEHKFLLSSQKIKDWVKDQIKGGAISYIIIIILVAAFYHVLNRYAHAWWLVISLVWISFSLILARLAPVIIIPLFFKYKKLSDDNLKNRIMNLADKMNVKILDCFEIDFSKKTLKANAAFVGWGKTRRVILADTLKDKYTYDEVEVILAHELAHYRLKHLMKLILVNSAATILTFYAIYLTNPGVLRLFGLNSLYNMTSLPVVFLYFLLFGVITRPFENFVSRRFERNADKMALEITGLKEAFISTMEKLASQNLADKNPHPFIKFYFFDHPPISERIQVAKALK